MRSNAARGSVSFPFGRFSDFHEMFALYAHEYPESQLPAVIAGSLPSSSVRKRVRLGLIKGSRRCGDWRIKGSDLLKLV